MAWFDRADQAMPTCAKAAGLTALTADKRLEELLVAWLAALTPHHAVTGKMLLYKLEPGHIHLQIGGLQRISRTVQWWREAARRKSLHLARITEESLLTGAYLRTSTGLDAALGRARTHEPAATGRSMKKARIERAFAFTAPSNAPWAWPSAPRRHPAAGRYPFRRRRHE